MPMPRDMCVIYIIPIWLGSEQVTQNFVVMVALLTVTTTTNQPVLDQQAPLSS